MYLQDFGSKLKSRCRGSLFSVAYAQSFSPRAKEYLHRLSGLGRVERIAWGWYYFPEKRDVWGFLASDRGFKVLVKQTAASIWNYDFVHRDVYRLAVEDASYKKALEALAEKRGWSFEVEYYDKVRDYLKYKKADGLFVETPGSCLVSCMSDWAFLDALAVLYFRRDEINMSEIKELGRWKRIAHSNIRVWTALKYACDAFNQQTGESLFSVEGVRLNDDSIKELIDEAVEKVMEFA